MARWITPNEILIGVMPLWLCLALNEDNHQSKAPRNTLACRMAKTPHELQILAITRDINPIIRAEEDVRPRTRQLIVLQ
jgi:hypothetical protein